MTVETQLNAIATKHGFSKAAVSQLYEAIQAGRGNSAQFSHPELGGMGQWMRNGMLMIGEMSNQSLKSRVDALCNDLAALYGSAPAASQPAEGKPESKQESNTWWPAQLGSPSSSGGQNSMHYAYFAQSNRLAVQEGKRVTVYDTTGYQIGGVSQQQGRDQTLEFSSQKGKVPVASLPVIV